MTTGWKLTRACRERLLRRFPPRYATAVADHVTLAANAAAGAADPPPPVADAALVGRADDGAGVEAFVVEIDGSTDRPDGGTWHVTWSLGAGRAAKESNDVIAQRRWTRIEGVALELRPATW